MQQELFESSIEALKDLRDELRGKVEDSTFQKLDKIINDLEHANKRNPWKVSKLDMLKALGIVLEAIPAIADWMKLLSGMK